MKERTNPGKVSHGESLECRAADPLPGLPQAASGYRGLCSEDDRRGGKEVPAENGWDGKGW